MKKLIVKILIILLTIVLVYGIYNYISLERSAVQLNFKNNNTRHILMRVIGSDLDTTDQVEIDKVTEYLSSVIYYRDQSITSMYNETPDIEIRMYDMSDKLIDSMEFSGDILFYKDKFYKLFPSDMFGGYRKFDDFYKTLESFTKK